MPDPIATLELAMELMRCPSVTPRDAVSLHLGALPHGLHHARPDAGVETGGGKSNVGPLDQLHAGRVRTPALAEQVSGGESGALLRRTDGEEDILERHDCSLGSDDTPMARGGV